MKKTLALFLGIISTSIAAERAQLNFRQPHEFRCNQVKSWEKIVKKLGEFNFAETNPDRKNVERIPLINAFNNTGQLKIKENTYLLIPCFQDIRTIKKRRFFGLLEKTKVTHFDGAFLSDLFHNRTFEVHYYNRSLQKIVEEKENADCFVGVVHDGFHQFQAFFLLHKIVTAPLDIF